MAHFKRNSLMVALFLLGTAFFANAEEQSRYELDLSTDIPLTLSAAGIFGMGTWLYHDMDTPDHVRSQDHLLPWDKPVAGRYSETADRMSDIGAFLAVAPFTIGAISWNQGASSGTEFAAFSLMFVQAIAIGNGINLAVRSMEIWPRPYMYAESGDGKEKAEKAKGEAYGSFFSGHATAAFTVATFTDQWFRAAYPNSPYQGIVRATAYSLAGLESALRVAAGKHFVSDVVVGALVGTGVSIGILEMHRKRSDKFSLGVGPGVAYITLRI